jgi:hypothetical protein
MAAEPRFEVVWPLGRFVGRARPAEPRLDRLEDKTIGLVWDYVFRGDEMFDILKDELSTRHPGVQFVDYPVFGNVHGSHERQVVAELPQRLAAHKVDAVIVGVGA